LSEAVSPSSLALPPSFWKDELLTEDCMVSSEFLCLGDKLLFREGRTKGLGIVKELGYDNTNPLEREVDKP
jgi:hypothetical protein